MSGNAILKYRGHAKVTEKVALCLAFMDQKSSKIETESISSIV